MVAGELPKATSDGGAHADVVDDVSFAQPLAGRQLIAVLCWTLLADVLVFRALGYGGPGLFVALVPLLFFVGCPGLTMGPARKLTVCLILLVAVRILWAGSAGTILSAVVLTIALSMSAAGCVPYVLEGCVLAGRAVFDGFIQLRKCRWSGPGKTEASSGAGPANARRLAWMLPLAVGVVFATIFVFANPDLFDWVSIRVAKVSDRFQLWLRGISVWELPFCVLSLAIGVGLMIPRLPLMRIGPTARGTQEAATNERSPFYSAFRNSLVTLIVLFTVYLAFEFSTLWKRDFQDGFYYAGYAHQGAGWLTFALALATAALSFVFSGSMLRDDRLGFIRHLAWIWSAQNFFLAAAVYNRLMIYVGFNGMTRMRTIGFFGITLVVIGFGLVLYKIRREHGFWWLIRAQLTALVLTMILYSAFPVDYVVHRYNAQSVASGYLRPSVMIAVKPIDDEGVFPLLKLVVCEDDIIRDGVLALLAKRQREIEQSPALDWTQFQGSRELLRRRLQKHQLAWSDFRNRSTGDAAIQRFHDYAMQWY